MSIAIEIESLAKTDTSTNQSKEIQTYENLEKHGFNLDIALPSYIAGMPDGPRKYNLLGEARDTFKVYLYQQVSKLGAKVEQKLANKYNSNISNEHSSLIDEISHHAKKELVYRIKFNIDELFDKLPEAEQQAIIKLSTQKHFDALLLATHRFMHSQSSPKSQIFDCNMIYQALTLATYQSLKEANLNERK